MLLLLLLLLLSPHSFHAYLNTREKPKKEEKKRRKKDNNHDHDHDDPNFFLKPTLATMKFSTLLVTLTVAALSSSAMAMPLPTVDHHKGSKALKKEKPNSNCPNKNHPPLRERGTQEDDGSCEKSKREADANGAIVNRPQDFAVVPNMKKWQTRDADAAAVAAPVPVVVEEDVEDVQRRALYIRV